MFDKNLKLKKKTKQNEEIGMKFLNGNESNIKVIKIRLISHKSNERLEKENKRLRIK